MHEKEQKRVEESLRQMADVGLAKDNTYLEFSTNKSSSDMNSPGSESISQERILFLEDIDNRNELKMEEKQSTPGQREPEELLESRSEKPDVASPGNNSQAGHSNKKSELTGVIV